MGRKSSYMGVARNKKQEEKEVSAEMVKGSHSHLATPAQVSEDKFCNECGEPLHKIKWSKGFCLLVCDNGNCIKYRQPQEGVSRALL